jgi:hypothetical protein
MQVKENICDRRSVVIDAERLRTGVAAIIQTVACTRLVGFAALFALGRIPNKTAQPASNTEPTCSVFLL